MEKDSKINCPYCKKILDKEIQRKGKCPFCKNTIYVRKSPLTHEKILVTEDEAKKIDLEWKRIRFRNKWLRTLKSYGITEEDFNKYKEKLSKRFGERASDRDVIWLIFNELIQKMRDFHSLRMIYYEMALFLNEEGKDFFTVLQQSIKMELMRYKKDGVKRVRIIAAKDACSACKKLDDNVLSIKDALERMPIPCKECTHKLYDENRGFCRCAYVPEF